MIATRLLYLLLWVWAAAGLGAGVFSGYVNYWWLAGLVILAIVAYDYLWLRLCKPFRIERRVQNTLAVGAWSPVRLNIHNDVGRTVRIEVFDHYPVQADCRGMPSNFLIPDRGTAAIKYHIRPFARGTFDFPGVQIRQTGRLGLLKRDQWVETSHPIRVYPNFANVTKFSLLSHEQRQNQMGIRKRRRRGEGLDFRQLREYRLGDSLRQVDWNATSRVNKLISREYQDERDQRVVFLVDCSRRMLTNDDELNHFDQTLNAVLLLSYVATRQGDAVGLLTFSGEERWMAPRKGAVAVNAILDAVFDLQPSLQSADYTTCARRLMSVLNKRSLIIFVTNMRDEDSEELLPALQLLRRKHLVLFASMRERVLDLALKQPISGFHRALEQASIHKYMEYRDVLIDRIRQQNVLTLDVNPRDLPVSMVNSYLQIKSSGIL